MVDLLLVVLVVGALVSGVPGWLELVRVRAAARTAERVAAPVAGGKLEAL